MRITRTAILLVLGLGACGDRAGPLGAADGTSAGSEGGDSISSGEVDSESSSSGASEAVCMDIRSALADGCGGEFAAAASAYTDSPNAQAFGEAFPPAFVAAAECAAGVVPLADVRDVLLARESLVWGNSDVGSALSEPCFGVDGVSTCGSIVSACQYMPPPSWAAVYECRSALRPGFGLNCEDWSDEVIAGDDTTAFAADLVALVDVAVEDPAAACLRLDPALALAFERVFAEQAQWANVAAELLESCESK